MPVSGEIRHCLETTGHCLGRWHVDCGDAPSSGDSLPLPREIGHCLETMSRRVGRYAIVWRRSAGVWRAGALSAEMRRRLGKYATVWRQWAIVWGARKSRRDASGPRRKVQPGRRLAGFSFYLGGHGGEELLGAAGAQAGEDQEPGTEREQRSEGGYGE